MALVERVADRAVRYDGPAPAAARCANCRAPVAGRFCATCGQRTDVTRLTVRGFASEVFAQTVQLDHGLLNTVVSMITRPGRTVRSYIDGARRPFTAPLSYALLAIGFAVLRTSLAPSTSPTFSAMMAKNVGASASSFTPASDGLMMRALTLADDHPALLAASFLIPIVLLLRYFFRKQRLNVAEISTFVCFVFGTAIFIKVIARLPFDLAGYSGSLTLLKLALPVWAAYAGMDFFGRSLSSLARLTAAVFLGVFTTMLIVVAGGRLL